jgi:hypothetical protein
VEDKMGKHFAINVLVADSIMFEAANLSSLSEILRREDRYWSKIFPNGVRNLYSETTLRPHYQALLEAVTIFPFEISHFDLKGWSEYAILPGSETVEGRTLAYYAKTGLAFSIVQFLWTEAGWLAEDGTGCEADAFAGHVGKVLIGAVRLGKSF